MLCRSLVLIECLLEVAAYMHHAVYKAHVGIGLESRLIACKTITLQITLKIVLLCQRFNDRSGSRSFIVMEEYQMFHYRSHHPEVFLGGLVLFLVNHGSGGLVCLIVVRLHHFFDKCEV